MEKPMRTISFIALLILFAAGYADSQYSYPDPDVSIQNMEATVRHLTSLTPARSYEHIETLNKAADFISQRLSEIGLKPEEQSFLLMTGAT